MTCDPQDLKWWPFFEKRFEADIVDALDTNSKAGAANIAGILVDSLNYFLKNSFPIEGLAEDLYDGFSGALVVAIGTALQDGDDVAAFAAGVGAGIDYLVASLTKTFAERIINSVVSSSMTLLEVEGVEAAAILAAPEILATLAGIAFGVFGGVVAQASVEATEDWNKANTDTTCPPKPQIPSPPSKSDPLVLDLADTGINLTTVSGSKAYFDFTGSGVSVQTGWISAGEGILVIAPADGATVTAADMLGAYSGNGFADLAALDSNGDGVINANDPVFSQLRVWVDTSGTGQSSAGELFTLAQLGITSINVNSTFSGQIDNGNTIVSTSSFSITNPTTGVVTSNTIAEVNLQTNLQITHLTSSNVTPSETALSLPNLTGFGFLPDLDIAVTTDPTLEKMVYNLVFNSATMNSAQFNLAFQNMLYEWAGVTDISQTAYGEHIDGQHLAFIYAYFGINPAADPDYAGWEPNWHNGPSVWEPTYQKIIQFYELAFMSQISHSLSNLGFDLATAYANPYAAFAMLAYDPEMNTFNGIASGSQNSLPWLLSQSAPSDAAAASTYWSQAQGALQLMNYTQGESGIDGQILQQIAQSETEAQVLNAVNAMNSVASVFTITTDSNFTNISGDGGSVTYAGTGSVEIPAQYQGTVVVPVGCTQLTLDNSNGVKIVLQDATNPADVTFSVSGSDLIATFSDGTTLDLVGQAANVTAPGTSTSLMFSGGTPISQIEIVNDIVAAEAASGSTVIQGYAVGGTLEGAIGANDVLIAGSNPVSATGSDSLSSPGTGTTVFDVGTGNDVLLPDSSSNPSAQVRNVIEYGPGDGSDIVVTAANPDYDPREVYWSASGLADYVYDLLANTLNGQAVFEAQDRAYNGYGSNNSIAFGSGITAADVTISAAGSQTGAIDNIFLSDPTTANYMFYSAPIASWLTPWSLVVSIGGANTITFTGGADALQEIDFADGTVMTAQEIGQAYVASEEAQNFALIQGTELGNTLQGTIGSQVLLGFSGNDTLVAGTGSDTLIAGGGVNTYVVNAGSGDAVIINNRSSDDSVNTFGGSPLFTSSPVGSGQTEMDDTLVFGTDIDPSQITVAAVASIDGSDPGLPDILLTDTATGQTVRLTGENQDLDSFNTLAFGNNGAAVGQVQFADGTIWTVADLLSMANGAGEAAEAAQYPGYTIVNGTAGDDTLQAGATPELLAGGLGNDTYIVNSGDASVVVDCGLNGSGGGAVDQYDQNILKFGAGISAGDITVTQAANGSDLLLTIGSTGQTVTLANQLTSDAGAIIGEVVFADGTTWTNAQLFNASVAGSLAAGASSIYGSVSIANLGGAYGDLMDEIATGAVSAGNASVTLIGQGENQLFEMGSGSETANVSSDYAAVAFAPSFGNDVLDFTGDASNNFDGDVVFEGESPTGAQWSPDGNSVILSFAGSAQTLTLENFGGNSDVNFYNYTNGYISGGPTSIFSLFPSLFDVTASAGQSSISLSLEGVTVDPNGNASTINLTGDGDTVIYRPGYGAVEINILDGGQDGQNPPDKLELDGTSADPLGFSGLPVSTIYSSDAAGDLKIDFGNGDVVTIDHEFNADGSISANGISEIYYPGDNGPSDIDLTDIGLESRPFDAAAGQTSLIGDGNGGIFNPEGIASTISDSGTNTDIIVYNRGFGAVTIGAVSTNAGNAIEFGAGITLSSLTFSTDATGDLIISLGGGDQITIVDGLSNSLGLVQYNGDGDGDGDGTFGVSNLIFSDGSSATISTGTDSTDGLYLGQVQGSDGSTVNIDTSAFAYGGTLTSQAGPAIFNPNGVYGTVVGTGGADVINYTQAEGSLTINEASYGPFSSAVLNVTDDNLSFVGQSSGGGDSSYGGGDSSYGGGSSSYGGGGGGPSIPDLGGVVGVTEDANGDVTLYFGNGDNVTLLGQLADTLGTTSGVSEIIANAGNGVTDTWTNSDILAALDYEAETGFVPNGPGSVITPQITPDSSAFGFIEEQQGFFGSVAPDVTGGTIGFEDANITPDDTATILGVSVSGPISGALDNATLLAMFSLGAVTQPGANAQGSVSWTFLAPEGTFAYLSADEALTLTYAVEIANAVGTSTTETVTVIVVGTNQAPTITASATTATGAIIDEATPTNAASIDQVNGAIAFGDANLDDTHSATVTGVTAAGATGGLPSDSTLLSLLTLGSLTEQSGTSPGTVGWSFAVPNGDFAYLSAGQTVTLTYAVQLSDNEGGSVTQDVAITITGDNDVPVIVPASGITTGSITELSTASSDALNQTDGAIAFTDTDSGDSHSATVTGVTATGVTGGMPTTATLLSLLSLASATEEAGSTPASIAWNFTVPNSDFAYLSAGETVTLTYAVEVINSEGGTASQSVSITIAGTNGAPTIVPESWSSTTGSITESGANTNQSALWQAGEIAFSDANHDDTHATSVVGVSASGSTDGIPSTSTLLSLMNTFLVRDDTSAAPGEVDWEFDDANGVFDYLSAGEAVTLDYTVQIADNQGGVADQVVSITVTGAPYGAPEIVAGSTTATATISELGTSQTGDTASGTIAFTDTDFSVDGAHTATVTGCGVTGNFGIDLPSTAVLMSLFSLGTLTEETGSSTGSIGWSFADPDNVFAYLAFGQTVTLTYDVKIQNSEGGSTTEVVTFTITGAHGNPTIVAASSTIAGTIVDLGTSAAANTVDTSSGTIAFTDASNDGTHTASILSVTAAGQTAGLPTNSTLLSMLTLGTLTENGGSTPGSVTWTFAGPDADFNYLSQDETVTLNYVVEIANSASGKVLQNVAVTIIGANDAPTIVSASTTATGSIVEFNANTPAGSLNQTSGLIAFSDANLDDTHTLSVTGVTASGDTTDIPSTAALLSLLTFTGVTDGAGTGSVGWDFAAPNGDFDYLSPGEAVTLTYAVQVSDNHGGAVTQNVAITITGAANGPVIVPASTSASGSIAELDPNTAPTAVNSANGNIAFSDGNFTDTHTATITGVTASGDTSSLPSNATLLSLLSLGDVTEETGDASGSLTWSFSAPNSDFDYLDQDQSLTLTYAVQIGGSSGGSTTQDVTIVITGTYDLPAVVAGSSVVSAEFTNLGTGAPQSSIDAGSGSIVFTDFNPDTTHTATVVSVFATGTTTSSGPSTVDFTTGVIPYLPSNATLLSMLTLGSFTDDTGGTPGSVSWNFAAPDSDFDYLSQGETVTLNYVVEIAGSSGGQATQIVTVTIAGTNDAPVILTSQTDAAGTIYEQAAPTPSSAINSIGSGTIAFTDANLDDVHTATVTGVTAAGDVSDIPSNGTLLSLLSLGPVTEEAGASVGTVGWGFSVANGVFDYLGQGQSVTLTYTVQLADNHGGTASQNLTVTIVGADDVPVIVPGSTNATGAVTDEAAITTPASTLDATSGSIVFTDAFSADTHTATVTGVSVTGDTSSLPSYATLMSLMTLGSVTEEAGDTPGSLTWNFSVPNGDFAYLGLGDTVTLNYQVGIANSTGGSTTQNVAITVTGTLHDVVATAGETLTGTAAPSELDGSAGNDTLYAGSGGDFLVGGPGDTLYGGAGADTFVFHPGFGQETLYNFNPAGANSDVLQFDSNVFSDWAHLLGATQQQGSDLLITLDASDRLLLKNVSLASFTSADAKFV